MADTPSVAVQAPPGYGKTELFHLPLIALASKGDVKNVSVLQSHDSQNFIEEGDMVALLIYTWGIPYCR